MLSKEKQKVRKIHIYILTYSHRLFIYNHYQGFFCFVLFLGCTQEKRTEKTLVEKEKSCKTVVSMWAGEQLRLKQLMFASVVSHGEVLAQELYHTVSLWVKGCWPVVLVSLSYWLTPKGNEMKVYPFGQGDLHWAENNPLAAVPLQLITAGEEWVHQLIKGVWLGHLHIHCGPTLAQFRFTCLSQEFHPIELEVHQYSYWWGFLEILQEEN